MRSAQNSLNIICLQTGQSLVEILIAVSILSISALGLTGSIVHLGQSKKKAEQVSYILALESSIAASMADSSNYTDEQKQMLREGTVPNDLALNLQLPNSPTDTLRIQRGQRAFLSSQLEICDEIDRVDCIYSFQFEVVNKRSLDPLLPETFGLAYRIELQSENTIPSVIGVELPSEEVEDYELEIPPAVYRLNNENGCADDELFVIGLSRLTGQVSCIKKPTNSCAANEVMTGYTVGLTSTFPASLQLQVRCQPVVANVSCPEKYSLQSLSVSGYNLNGTCTYAGTAAETGSELFRPLNLSYGEALACPEDYSVPSATTLCGFETLNNNIGTCSFIGSWSANVNVQNGSWPDPSNPAATCSQRITTTWSPVNTTVEENLSTGVRVQESRSGRGVSCRLEIPQRTCPGSSYSGRLTLLPTCLLNPPFVSAIPASTSL